MREVIILAAGRGSKFFPFDKVGSKTMRPVGCKPLLAHLVDSIRTFCEATVHLVTLEEYQGTIASYFEDHKNVIVHTIKESGGSAETLLEGWSHTSADSLMVLHGDTIIDKESLRRLWEAEAPSVLVFPVRGRASDWICCSIETGCIKAIGAHHRGKEMTHQMAGFVVPRSFEKNLFNTPEYFPGMKVGQGAPHERYVEAALSRYLRKNRITAIEALCYFDIDKPWQLLEANQDWVNRECGALSSHVLGEGSSIDSSADIRGFVTLGKNSRIGRNVCIAGNIIAGDNTLIDNGAIISGAAIIGNNTLITNYAKVHGGSIGNDCILDHGTEFLGGTIMDKVYFCHYGEFFGAAGSNAEFGAGTVCGTLRFDDGAPELRVKGRRELAGDFSNASFVGDYSRTGVGVMMMPGCRVGAYCVVGPGVVVQGDYAHNTLTRLVQQLEVKEWGPERYGW
jgi:bifunctional UDP-N-acetylglucosamine pyrophosphorylase/glucosamine-1-phosphate N-acetyltransferase